MDLADDSGWGFAGCFGQSRLTVNVARFDGRRFYADGPDERLHAFLIHEFAHYCCKDHLSEDYYAASCRLGAKLTALALAESHVVADVVD